MIKRASKLARPPATAVAWWGAWWAWRNRSAVVQIVRFLHAAIGDRRPVRDVATELRVRSALLFNRKLRESPEVQVASVTDGIVRLLGVPGGTDTERAAQVAARIRGITAVELVDKVAVVDPRDVDIVAAT